MCRTDLGLVLDLPVFDSEYIGKDLELGAYLSRIREYDCQSRSFLEATLSCSVAASRPASCSTTLTETRSTLWPEREDAELTVERYGVGVFDACRRRKLKSLPIVVAIPTRLFSLSIPA